MSIKNPITMPNQMRHPLICDRPEPGWYERTRGRWWSLGYTGRRTPEQEKLMLLSKRLLGFGGHGVVLPDVEEDYDAIMERGQLFDGKGTRFRKGRPNQCHCNSCLLWEANKDISSIATGYALSQDGLWRQHSWVVQPLTVKYRVWETTVERVAYFGFIMTPEECEQFAYDNF